MIAGAVAATVTLADAAGQPSSHEARIWLHPDLLFAQRLPAGSLVAVGVAGDAAAGNLMQLSAVFHGQYAICEEADSASTSGARSELAGSELAGSYVVLATAWPMAGLAKGTAVLSAAVRDGLARPTPNSVLVVYTAPAGGTGTSSSSRGGGINSSSGRCSVACNPPGQVRLEVCWNQAGDQQAALLPQAAAPIASTTTASQSPVARGRTMPQTPGARSPAAGTRPGAPMLSPAMRRGGGSSPIAPLQFSSSSRSGRTPPPASGSSASAAEPQPQQRAAAAEVLSGVISALQDSNSSGGGGRLSRSGASSSSTDSANSMVRLRGLVLDLVKRQLIGRTLLCGNLVAVQLGGQHLVLRVGSVVGTGVVTLEWHITVGASSQGTEQPLDSRTTVVEIAAAAAAGVDEGGDAGSPAALAAARAAAAGQAALAAASRFGGYAAQREALQQLVGVPLTAPHLFTEYGMAAPTGILLHGPPGENVSMAVQR